MASIKSSGDTSAAEDPVLTICKDILNRLPPVFDTIEVSEKYPITYTNSMNTVLKQEIIR